MRKPVSVVILIGLCVCGEVFGTAAAVVSSTQCKQWIRDTTDRVVRRKHSKATLDKWRLWREAHPGWHEKTKQEQLRIFDFACSAVEPELIVLGNLELLEPIVPVLIADEVRPILETIPSQYEALLSYDTTPSYATGAGYYPSYWYGGGGVRPTIGSLIPVTPVTPTAPVPEPSSYLLLGVVASLITRFCKRRELI